MSIIGTLRSLAQLGFDVGEAIFYGLFDFDRVADEMWAEAGANRLADVDLWIQCEQCGRHTAEKHVQPCVECQYAPKSSSSATASAADDPSPCSATTPGVEQGEAPNLTPRDLYDAATALRAKARDSDDPRIAAEWGLVAAKFDMAFCDAVKK